MERGEERREERKGREEERRGERKREIGRMKEEFIELAVHIFGSPCSSSLLPAAL